MNFRVIYALVLRYIFLYARTPMRLIELVFWPVVDLMVWGNLTIFLRENSEKAFADYLLFLIGGMILWDVLFRAQQGVAISFLEDVWTRNLLNIFVAPVRVVEYVAATFTIGFLRICVTMVVLCTLAAVGYNFNIFQLEWALIPFFANLLVFGWALGMISTALILRWGQAVESLAWAVPFFIQPIVAVFYPVAKLPGWLQPVAWCFPATHIFEGMRQVLHPVTFKFHNGGLPLNWAQNGLEGIHAAAQLQGGTFPWSHIGWAVLLNIIFLTIAGIIFGTMLMNTKKRGLLTKFATQ